jgi:hypothetical protein
MNQSAVKTNYVLNILILQGMILVQNTIKFKAPFYPAYWGK